QLVQYFVAHEISPLVSLRLGPTALAPFIGHFIGDSKELKILFTTKARRTRRFRKNIIPKFVIFVPSW
ncbi:MAG: hypothetical protein ACXW6T_28040, partial [Candidatus Binatia bacterium]